MSLKSSLSEKIWHMSPVLSALLGIFVSVSLTRLFSNFVIWKTATEHIVTTILQIRLEETYQIQEQEGLSSVPSGKLGLRESLTSNLTRVKMQQPLPLYKMTSEELFFSHCTHVHALFPSPNMWISNAKVCCPTHHCWAAGINSQKTGGWRWPNPLFYINLWRLTCSCNWASGQLIMSSQLTTHYIQQLETAFRTWRRM